MKSISVGGVLLINVDCDIVLSEGCGDNDALVSSSCDSSEFIWMPDREVEVTGGGGVAAGSIVGVGADVLCWELLIEEMQSINKDLRNLHDTY